MAGSQQYKIKLSSYDTTLLENTVRKIIEASKKLGAKINGPIPLPTRKEV
jgi:small subunit ribosomal protein S10